MKTVRSLPSTPLLVCMLALSGCGDGLRSGSTPEEYSDALMGAARTGSGDDPDSGTQQLLYALRYERVGNVMRPAGTDNFQRTSFTFTLDVNQNVLVDVVPSESGSGWPAWQSTGIASLMQGSVTFSALMTVDQPDLNDPRPLQVELTGDIHAPDAFDFRGMFIEGIRTSRPRARIVYDVPMSGTIMGYGMDDNPAALLMLTARFAPVEATEEGGDIVGRVRGQMIFHPDPDPRPPEEGRAMIYDTEELLLEQAGILMPALRGAFEGAVLTGDPDGSWSFTYENELESSGSDETITDRVSFRVIPVSRTLPLPGE